MIRAGRLRARHLRATIPAASRRCIRAGSFDGSRAHDDRSAPASALVRAGWILAREGVVRRPARRRSCPARRASPGASPALLDAPPAPTSRQRSERLSQRRGAARPLLCQARPVPGDAARRRRQRRSPLDLAKLQDRMPPFPTRAGDRRRSRRRSAGRVDELFVAFGEPVAAASIAQVHPAEVDARRRAAQGRGQGHPAGRARSASARDLESYFLAARLQERFVPSARRLRPVEVVETLAQTDQDRDGSAAGGGRLFGDRPRTPRTIRASACRPSTGSAPAATSSPWSGSTASR